MVSTRAAFSHGPGEFLGIKQLDGKGYNAPDGWDCLGPEILVLKAPDLLALENDFLGCQQTRWFTPFYLYQLCKKPTLKNRPGTRGGQVSDT